jgi:hypothetical protein
VVGYVLVALMLLVPVVNEANEPFRRMAKAQRQQAAGEQPVDILRGAMARWTHDIRAFWAGENIYLSGTPDAMKDAGERGGWPALHPNMPVVVVLLTPFTYLPPLVMGPVYAAVKTVAWIYAMILALRLATHDRLLMTGGVALLAFVAAWDFFMADINHANTNIFAAFFLILHLWLYRTGRDIGAGAALAMAICLKMTPGLFGLYWLYQRQWKLVVACGVAFVLLTLSPVVLLGWERLLQDLHAWWLYVIYPATFGGQWWPTNINQSLHGMVARLFIGGLNGNYVMDMDLPPDQQPMYRSIAIYDLGMDGAKRLLQVLQLILLAITAWAIGWRKLPRDDGRRALHWGLVSALMLLLSQRSWDHHAVHLMIAHAAIAYTVFYGRLSKQAGTVVGWLFILGFLWVYATSGDIMKGLFGKEGQLKANAWGTTFWHFLLMWGLGLWLALRLKRQAAPYLVEQEEDKAAQAPLQPVSVPVG